VCLSKRRAIKPTKGTKATAKKDEAKVRGGIRQLAKRMSYSRDTETDTDTPIMMNV